MRGAKQANAGRTSVPAHTFLNPSTMPATRGYTHVVETRGPSRTIYLAGQLGMTPDGKFAGGPGDFRAQAAQAFENLKLGLTAAGAGIEHVVKVTVYFTDMANLQTYFEVRDRYVNTKAPPASTAVQISKLARRRVVRDRGRRRGARIKISPSPVSRWEKREIDHADH
jgi:enamine deaminase RidA (YjgF/YER057c/UK114 family)